MTRKKIKSIGCMVRHVQHRGWMYRLGEAFGLCFSLTVRSAAVVYRNLHVSLIDI